MAKMSSTATITIEYSLDQEERARRLGGVLEYRGCRVVYRRVGGARVIRFHVGGVVYSWEEFDIMVRMALPRVGCGSHG